MPKLLLEFFILTISELMATYNIKVHRRHVLIGFQPAATGLAKSSVSSNSTSGLRPHSAISSADGRRLAYPGLNSVSAIHDMITYT